MKKIVQLILVVSIAGMTACQKGIKNDSVNATRPGGIPPWAEMYEQSDQMARPVINTVFVPSADKNTFNTTVPSAMNAAFATKFLNSLMALNPGYTTNLLGLDAANFTGFLSTDVLNVSTTGVTTYFDGTNVLTGRALADDVIDVSLILVFGGPTGTSNPGLTSDNVNANDKPFLSSFPYLAAPH